MIDLNNLNVWLAVAALGLGVIVMVVVALGVPAAVGEVETVAGLGQFALLLATFIAMFLAAMLTGRIARENAVTYGLICGAGSLIVIVAAMPLGTVTVLLALIALAGGLNGGMVIERSNRRHRR